MLQHVGDELHLVAVVAGVVAGGGVRPAGEVKVGEPGGLNPEEGLGTVGPMVDQRTAAPSPDAHARQRTGPEVEARRPDDHVEFAMRLGRLDAPWGEPHHGCRLQVDQLDVGLVVDLEVGRDEGRALLAEAVILGDQPVRRLGVVDETPDLAGQEVAPCCVGIAIEHHVAVVAGELREAGAPPHLLEERGALLLRVVEGGAIVRDVQEPAG